MPVSVKGTSKMTESEIAETPGLAVVLRLKARKISGKSPLSPDTLLTISSQLFGKNT
jgi:hypothetical protein